MDGSIFPQAEHTAGWARGFGRGDRNISQSEGTGAVHVATQSLSEGGRRQMMWAYFGLAERQDGQRGDGGTV